MSLSDCEKCWDTPCTCGYEWYKWDVERLEALVFMLSKIIREKRGKT